jgi:hypothetical protein
MVGRGLRLILRHLSAPSTAASLPRDLLFYWIDQSKEHVSIKNRVFCAERLTSGCDVGMVHRITKDVFRRRWKMIEGADSSRSSQKAAQIGQKTARARMPL